MSIPSSASLRIARLILHIGTYKTGTSSIQRFLFRNRRRLARVGIFYPTAGRGHQMSSPGQHELATLTEEEAGAPGRGFAALVDEIRSAFVRAECHTLILSAEDFCGLKHPNILAGAFPAFRTEVFLSLRPQYEIISPFYYTAVAMRVTTLSPDEFLEAHLRQFLNYHDMLRRWQTGCPNAIFHVRRYERGSPARANSIADFVNVLGIPISDVGDSAEDRFHATLPALATLALREFALQRHTDAEFWTLYEWLRENLNLLGQEKSVYSPARRLEVHETYRQSNRRVRAEFIDGQADDLFAEPVLGDSDRWLAEVGDSTAFVGELLTRFAERAVELEAPEEA